MRKQHQYKKYIYVILRMSRLIVGASSDRGSKRCWARAGGMRCEQGARLEWKGPFIPFIHNPFIPCIHTPLFCAPAPITSSIFVTHPPALHDRCWKKASENVMLGDFICTDGGGRKQWLTRTGEMCHAMFGKQRQQTHNEY